MKKLSPSIVLVKNIHCPISCIGIPETVIETGAKLILEVEGVINPIILRRSGLEHYTVIAGHLEYYAALRAREIDLTRGETINAYIVDPDNEAVLIEQIKIFREAKHFMATPHQLSQTASGDTTTTIVDIFDKHLQTLSHTVQMMLQALSNINIEISSLQNILPTLTQTVPTNFSTEGSAHSESIQSRALNSISSVPEGNPTEKSEKEVKGKGTKVATKRVATVEKTKKRTSTKEEKSPPKATQQRSLLTSSATKSSTADFLNKINNLPRNDLISELMRIKVKENIIDALLKNRPFQSIADLNNIKGLGAKTLDKIKKIWE